MHKDCSIANTTKEQRQKIIADGRGLAALSLIDTQPSEFVENLINDYIEGKIELIDAYKIVADKYKGGAP